MTPLDQARKDYARDPAFRFVVNALVDWIINGGSPARAWIAASLAGVIAEEYKRAQPLMLRQLEKGEQYDEQQNAP
jgi:hypothetical protein